MSDAKPIWIRDPLAILADGAERGIVVKGGRIVELVPAGAAPATADVAVFDAGDHVVLPGLINTHHHFYQTLTRALPAAMVRWLSVIVSGGHFRSVRSIKRVRCVCGSENSQVPPASQASPGVQTGSCARVCGWATAVMVFKSMATPTLPTSESSREKVLQDERQVATTSRSKSAIRPAPALQACRERM